MKRLFEAAKGTKLEIPILLGALGPLRRAEIVALEMSDLDSNGVLHVQRAYATDQHQRVVKKSTKTYESDRYIKLPDTVVEKIREQGYICNCSMNYISTTFPKLLRKAGIKHFRFHDLRHAFVSIAHAAKIPDAYIKERGGWATDYVMKSVYMHTLDEDRRKNQEEVNDVLSDLLSPGK